MRIAEIPGISETQLIGTHEILKKRNVKQKNSFSVSSGSRRFDKALGGGFYGGDTYLIFGAYKTGKTQLSHQLCIQIYNHFFAPTGKNPSHTNRFIYYIDTEGSFRPERIREMATYHSLDPDNILDKIIVSNVISNSALHLSVQKLREKLASHPPLLIVVDSINNHFRSEQMDSHNSFQKLRSEFFEILTTLNTISKECNTITILTAQVAPNFIKDPHIKEIPAANQYLNHFVSEYVYLSHKEEDKSYIHLVNSHHNPERRILYKITSEGIKDYKI